jgi:hypothetical protein
LHPAAPQFCVFAGIPSMPHVTAEAPLQYATFGSHVLQRSIWQPNWHVCELPIAPFASHDASDEPSQNVVFAAHSLQWSVVQPN